MRESPPAPRTLYRKLLAQRAGVASGVPLPCTWELGAGEPGLDRAQGVEPVETRIRINGLLSRQQPVEDLVDRVLARFGHGGLPHHVIEFCGNAVGRLSIQARCRLCAAAMARGVLAAVIAPDRRSIDAALARHPDLPETALRELQARCRALRSDFGAPFEHDLVYDGRCPPRGMACRPPGSRTAKSPGDLAAGVPSTLPLRTEVRRA